MLVPGKAHAQYFVLYHPDFIWTIKVAKGTASQALASFLAHLLLVQGVNYNIGTFSAPIPASAIPARVSIRRGLNFTSKAAGRE